MELSVIIATKNALRSIRPMMNAMLPQLDFAAMEVIVVDASTDGTRSIIKAEYPQAMLIQCSEECLVPELWSRGVLLSHGQKIAIFSAHCIPAHDWIKKALTLLTDEWDGVGSAMELSARADAMDRAAYFCRYARYMPPFPSHETWDLPGDSAAYRRESLFRYRDLFQDGFWEPAINRRMFRDGCKLRLDLSLRVEVGTCASFAEFFANRFSHGARYGVDRELAQAVSLVYFLFSFLLPFLLLFRTALFVRRKGVSLGCLFLSAPWLFSFFTAWSMGEAWGYLQRMMGKSLTQSNHERV